MNFKIKVEGEGDLSFQVSAICDGNNDEDHTEDADPSAMVKVKCHEK